MRLDTSSQNKCNNNRFEQWSNLNKNGMLVTMQMCPQDKLSSVPFQADYWPYLKILEVGIAMTLIASPHLFVFPHFL